jgi:hexosaminidase
MLAILLGLFLGQPATAHPGPAQQAPFPALVPQPVSISIYKEPGFELKASTRILVPPKDAGALQAAGALVSWLVPSTGMVLGTEEDTERAKGSILFTREKADPALGSEGYVLEVNSDSVLIRAGGDAGLYYAAQTLRQLFPPEIFARTPQKDVAWEAPALFIRDQPRFSWRGWMLDVSRHFFTKDEVKRCIDQLAVHKLNTFHWHIVDDHGWRIAIRKYPRLTEIGAWRSATGFGLNPADSTAYDKDGRYGGFYTQEEIREVVSYAAARNITVVPEIEMPGHSIAALAAHPEFSCSGGPFDRDVPAGVHAGIYCPGNEATFEFLENVLTEVFELFPSTFIHLGGDEVPREEWKKCAKCRARMDSEKLADVEQLQSWFLKRVERFVNAQGRRVIGWDEILEGGLAPHAAVMSWRGTSGGLAAAGAGHDVVMSPNAELYLDHYQARSGEPKAIGGYSPIEEVYLYEPIPEALAADKHKHVLGAQGNLWSEYIPNARQVEYMTWPRECAIAERTWSPRDTRDLSHFLARMDVHSRRLEWLGVNYRPTAPAALDTLFHWTAAGTSLQLGFRPPFAGAQIRYTLDGSEPTMDSARGDGPTPLPAGPTWIKARVFRAHSRESFFAEALALPGPMLVSASHTRGLERAFDGDENSSAVSNASLFAGDNLRLQLAGPRAFSSLEILSGDAEQAEDFPQAAVVEISQDGVNFQPLAEVFGNRILVDLSGQSITALRVRITRSQDRWWRIREVRLK